MAYIGNIPAEKYQTLQKQSFTTSATDTYTLSYSVTNPQDLALFINNVRQNPNDAYTVSGTTLTLSSAITSSDTMYAVFLGRAVETIAPATGSVTNAMLAGSIATSKLADGSTFATTNGITMADQWRLTTDFTASNTNANNITSNLERVDTSGQGILGTGMTESSGKFTFPNTGIYLVRAFGQFELNGDSRYNVIGIRLTTDNSTYNGVAQGNVFIQQTRSAGTSNQGVAETLVDVTNTTNVNIYFYTQIDNGATVKGSSTTNATSFTFIRLGDT